MAEKDALAQVFSCKFCEISKNIFFTEHLWRLLLVETLSIDRVLNKDVCTRMSSVCHSYVLVCHPHVTRM